MQLPAPPSPLQLLHHAPSEQSDHDSERFDRLVAPHIPLLIQAARAIIPEEDLAADVVQETVLRVWNRGWLPDDPRPVLLHLVRKSSLHQRRCLVRRRYHETSFAARAETCCEDDPLARLSQAERLRAVTMAVRCLPETWRRVLEPFAFGGKSYDAISRMTGIPIGTVRSRISRARAWLKEELGQEELG